MNQQGGPAAWRIFDGEGDWDYRTELPDAESRNWSARYGRHWEPLFTQETPAPLTKFQIDDLIEDGVFGSNPYELVRRIEEELGIFLIKDDKMTEIANVIHDSHQYEIETVAEEIRQQLIDSGRYPATNSTQGCDPRYQDIDEGS
jgi:hypothetical protein